MLQPTDAERSKPTGQILLQKNFTPFEYGRFHCMMSARRLFRDEICSKYSAEEYELFLSGFDMEQSAFDSRDDGRKMSNKDLIDRLKKRLALPSFLDTKDDLALFKESADTIENLDQPDCRLCRHIAIATPGGLRCVNKGPACVDGSQFKRTSIPPQWQTKKPRMRAQNQPRTGTCPTGQVSVHI